MLELSYPVEGAALESLIPHRAPFLFLSRIVSATQTEIVAEADVSPDWPLFEGHFPDNPILPGVVITEMVAQSGAALLSISESLPEDHFAAFSSIDQAKFKAPVRPGERLQISVELIKKRGPFFKFRGRAQRDEDIIAGVEFTAAQMAV